MGSNLDVAEKKLWQIAFHNLDKDKVGKLAMDDDALKVFLSEGSALRGTDIDAALAKFVGEDGSLTKDAFEKLMGESSKDDTVALDIFQQSGGRAWRPQMQEHSFGSSLSRDSTSVQIG